LLQDYQVRLAGLGDGKRSSGDCDTCILINLMKDITARRWGVPITGCFGTRLWDCLNGTRHEDMRIVKNESILFTFPKDTLLRVKEVAVHMLFYSLKGLLSACHLTQSRGHQPVLGRQTTMCTINRLKQTPAGYFIVDFHMFGE
jgi:hypothetical protein